MIRFSESSREGNQQDTVDMNTLSRVEQPKSRTMLAGRLIVE